MYGAVLGHVAARASGRRGSRRRWRNMGDQEGIVSEADKNGILAFSLEIEAWELGRALDDFAARFGRISSALGALDANAGPEEIADAITQAAR